jgi:hypothetical protein
MGLSGVTLAFLALQARLTPEREFAVALTSSKDACPGCLDMFTSMSLIGSLARKSRVAHVSHLGGLLFGMGYYELWMRRNKLRSISYKTRTKLVKFSPSNGILHTKC